MTDTSDTDDKGGTNMSETTPSVETGKSDELVEFLCLRMFPDKLTMAVQKEVVSGARKDELDAYLQSVAEYEDELRGLSSVALMQLIDDEHEKDKLTELEEAARVEGERFFNKPTARAYYRSWVERNYWTLDEATALILGKDPKVVNWDSIDPLVHKSAFARRYESLRRQFLRARFDGMLFEPLVPADFLRYAKTVGFALPVELDALLRSDDEEQARQQKHAINAIRLAELQKAVEEAARPEPDPDPEEILEAVLADGASKAHSEPAERPDAVMDDSVPDADVAVAAATEPSHAPKIDQAADIENDDAALADPLAADLALAAETPADLDLIATDIAEPGASSAADTRTDADARTDAGTEPDEDTGAETEAAVEAMPAEDRETLLKIFAAMAIGRYGYEPGSRRNSPITDIVKDHEKIGLSVDAATVRKWLRDAAELVPDQES